MRDRWNNSNHIKITYTKLEIKLATLILQLIIIIQKLMKYLPNCRRQRETENGGPFFFIKVNPYLLIY